MYQYQCVILRVVDGDTVDVDIDLGFGVWLKNQRVRIGGIDAPETRTRDLTEKAAGQASTQFVQTLLSPGERGVLISQEYNPTGKYGRIIGDFQVYDASTDSWTTLAAMLLREGHATPY